MPVVVRFAMIVASAAILCTALYPPQPCTRFADGATITISGVLESFPDNTQRTVQIGTAAREGCRVVRVRVPDDAPPVALGDRLLVTGQWMQQRVSVDGAASYDGIVIGKKIARARADGAHWLLRARGRVQQRIRRLFPHTYPLTEALLISQREALAPEVKEAFAASGLTHLLAISGSHVALIAAIIILAARLARCTMAAASIISIVGSVAYVVFLGAPFAAVRSLIQMLLLLLSRALQRPAHPLGLLATAAIIICAIAPQAPLDAGFQLSFAGITGIILWRRRLIDAMPASIPTALRDALATTTAATITTTPIAAYQFGVVSPVALLANLMAAPIIGLALPASVFVLLVSYVSMSVAHFLAGGAELTLGWLNHVALMCATIPGGHFYASPGSVTIYTIAALLVMCAHRSRVIAVAIAVTVMVAAPLLQLRKQAIEIHMIDVGQGDAFAIRSPRGRWLLIDAGPKSQRFDAGKRNVVPFLLHHQVSRLQAIVLSHPHLDHFGGARAVSERLRVGMMVDPGMSVPNVDFDSLVVFAARRHERWLAVRAGHVLDLDGMRLEFLSPDNVSLDPSADANDYSDSFRLSFGTFSALFLGDLYADKEQQLVSRFGSSLDVDLLKVAHHGSAGSTSAALLAAATPRVALVSVGRRNRYGHPSAQTIARLQAIGARVFRTDQEGTVSVTASRDGKITVRTGVF